MPDRCLFYLPLRINLDSCLMLAKVQEIVHSFLPP
jgi:hypothetical protein